ncbi:hypothetical protein B296_00011182 [Ensete ventricosum]|uniref:Annexin n=1 Tax=Ensete ventricosum TaxID=4639 RepID=A0A426ZVI2_ENSVE|nr:hypothetical protein B296_00011182 [Ensete ventricosum]
MVSPYWHSLVLQRAVYCWIFDPIEREAVMTCVALKRTFNYQVIIEIACVNSPKELLAVKEAYHARYKHSLEVDVAAHTVGDFRKASFGCTSLAKSEARILQDVVKQKKLNHEETIRILGLCYSGQSLAGEAPNEFASALRMAIECIVNPQLYFVDVNQP